MRTFLCHSRESGNPGSLKRLWIPAFAGMTIILIVALILTGCGKKKEKIDIVTELEPKPAVTEVKPEEKPAAAEEKREPQVVDNSQSPVSTDESVGAGLVPAQSGQPQGTAPTQGYEVPAQKVTTPAVPQTPPAPYPPYQGYATQPQGYATYPPRPYYPPREAQKPYKPPGPIESAGEFIGHLVNPFKREEDESKKTYQGI